MRKCVLHLFLLCTGTNVFIDCKMLKMCVEEDRQRRNTALFAVLTKMQKVGRIGAESHEVVSLWQYRGDLMAGDKEERKEGVQPSDASDLPENAQNTLEKKPFLGFVGSYTHGIDSKGRLIVPAGFRDALGQQFAVCPTPDFKAVAIYTLDGWQKRRDELTALVQLDARMQVFLDQFSKYSYVDCETDAQGRLLLPQKIRAWRLGDVREIDINGATSHIRVMPKAVSEEQDRLFDEMFEDPLAFMAQVQKSSN